MQRRVRVLFAKGPGKPVGHLSTFKQLQACQGGVKGENLLKGPDNFIIQYKGVSIRARILFNLVHDESW